jgi:hypothetical protein
VQLLCIQLLQLLGPSCQISGVRGVRVVAALSEVGRRQRTHAIVLTSDARKGVGWEGVVCSSHVGDAHSRGM